MLLKSLESRFFFFFEIIPSKLTATIKIRYAIFLYQTISIIDTIITAIALKSLETVI